MNKHVDARANPCWHAELNAGMKASSKRKTAKRKASGDEDYEPAPAAIAGATANDSMTYPKQQSSPFIGVTKV